MTAPLFEVNQRRQFECKSGTSVSAMVFHIPLLKELKRVLESREVYKHLTPNGVKRGVFM